MVICCDTRREMEDWLSALKAASLREYYSDENADAQEFLSNQHHWYVAFLFLLQFLSTFFFHRRQVTNTKYMDQSYIFQMTNAEC